MASFSVFASRFQAELILNNRVTAAENPIANTYSVSVPSTSVPSLFVSLHTNNDPDGLNEIAVPDYVRVAYPRDVVTVSGSPTIPWEYSPLSIQTRTLVRYRNSKSITFAAVSGAATVRSWGLWTSITGGTFICGGQIRVAGTNPLLGYVSGATTILSRGHGLIAGDTVRIFNAYDYLAGIGDALVSILPDGDLRTVAGAPAPTANQFDVTASVGNVGPIYMVRNTTISLSSGSVPSIPAQGIEIYIA